MMMVLLVLSLAVGLFVNVRVSMMMDQRKDITMQRLDMIQKQITWFRQVNHRLPCPASSTTTISSSAYGTEQRTGNCDTAAHSYPGTVQTAEGAIPTKTLGLGDEYMYDAWGRRFRFMVVQEFTRDCAFTTFPVVTAGYSGLTIKDEASNTISAQMLYAIVSFGVDGHGGYLQSGARYSSGSVNAAEQENCDCNSVATTTTVNGTFVDAPFTQSDTGVSNGYGNIVRYASREQIASQQDTAGTTETCP